MTLKLRVVKVAAQVVILVSLSVAQVVTAYRTNRTEITWLKVKSARRVAFVKEAHIDMT
jgi:hypothetical protein